MMMQTFRSRHKVVTSEAESDGNRLIWRQRTVHIVEKVHVRNQHQISTQLHIINFNDHVLSVSFFDK